MSRYSTQEAFLANPSNDTVEELIDIKHLVVHNDDVNTFDWVIQSLCEVCGHDELQAEQLALIVHFKGKACVKEGESDKLRPMRDSLSERGINATIE